MSNILEAIADIIQIIADNPASILIVLGFISILIAAFVPLQLGLQLFFRWPWSFHDYRRYSSACDLASKLITNRTIMKFN
jgi:hypothetical protein